jgi:hypothetical protein
MIGAEHYTIRPALDKLFFRNITDANSGIGNYIFPSPPPI